MMKLKMSKTYQKQINSFELGERNIYSIYLINEEANLLIMHDNK